MLIISRRDDCCSGSMYFQYLLRYPSNTEVRESVTSLAQFI